MGIPLKKRSRMPSGEVYDAVHPEFLRRLEETREKLWEYNNLCPSLTSACEAILRSLLVPAATVCT